MIKILLILIAVPVLIVIYFLILGVISKSGTALGIASEKLSPCPNKPNCVCSEYPDDHQHYVEPIQIPTDNIADLNDKIKTTVQKMGGELQNENDHYLAFTFTSKIFRYVDDVEVRIDIENNVLHIRSASRVGYSDLGANGKRVQQIRELLTTTLENRIVDPYQIN